jgi:WD40 repeat protein
MNAPRVLSVLALVFASSGISLAAPPEGERKLELVVQTGHTDSIKSASWSPDSKQIVTASEDDTAIVWDTASGQKLRGLTGHTGNVHSASYSPDGKHIVTASFDHTAIVWNAVTGQKLRTLTGHTGSVASASFSPGSKHIITASSDSTTRLWDAASGRELCSLISLDAGKDWLVTTPEGYFDGSAIASRFVSYRIAGTNDFVALESCRKQFERPGLLARVLTGKD